MVLEGPGACGSVRVAVSYSQKLQLTAVNKAPKIDFAAMILNISQVNNVCVTFLKIFLSPQYVGGKFFGFPTNGG
jgi:hypothetical protein